MGNPIAPTPVAPPGRPPYCLPPRLPRAPHVCRPPSHPPRRRPPTTTTTSRPLPSTHLAEAVLHGTPVRLHGRAVRCCPVHTASGPCCGHAVLRLGPAVVPAVQSASGPCCADRRVRSPEWLATYRVATRQLCSPRAAPPVPFCRGAALPGSWKDAAVLGSPKAKARPWQQPRTATATPVCAPRPCPRRCCSPCSTEPDCEPSCGGASTAARGCNGGRG